MTMQLCGSEHWKKENISKEEDEGIGAKNKIIFLCYVNFGNEIMYEP